MKLFMICSQTKQKKNFLKIKENLSLYPKNKLTTIHSE